MSHVRILQSIDEIPDEVWDELAPANDAVWSKSVFRAAERAKLADGFAYVVAYCDTLPISVLPTFWFSRWPLDENMSQRSRDAVASVRRIIPSFFTAPTLFCGSVLGSGHWLGLDAIPPQCVEQMIEGVLEISRKHKLPWLFYKDYPDTLLQRICGLGKAGPFAIVPALPDTVLHLDFADFEGYLTNLKTKARRNARNKIRRFETSDMRVERLRDFRGLIPDMMQLYEQVYRQAEFRFDHLNAEFFNALIDDPCADYELITCRRGSDLVAFALCLFRGTNLVNLRLGMDYEEINGSFAYFMMHYESIRAALERGCVSASFSITTYEPKIELGCKLRKLYHAGTHRNALARPILLKTLPTMMARFDAAKQFPSDVLVE